jgi:hypothetical protein
LFQPWSAVEVTVRITCHDRRWSTTRDK